MALKKDYDWQKEMYLDYFPPKVALENNKKNYYMNFDFLKSSRFWCLIVGALTIYLKTKGYVGEPEMLLVNTILGGFIAIRSLDRVGDKTVTAAQITAGVPVVPPINSSSTM